MLYTRESVVFESQLKKVDMKKPISVYLDEAGNEVVADGNHRGFNSESRGQKIKKRIIGTIQGDVRANPEYRPVSQLKVVSGEFPYSK